MAADPRGHEHDALRVGDLGAPALQAERARELALAPHALQVGDSTTPRCEAERARELRRAAQRLDLRQRALACQPLQLPLTARCEADVRGVRGRAQRGDQRLDRRESRLHARLRLPATHETNALGCPRRGETRAELAAARNTEINASIAPT